MYELARVRLHSIGPRGARFGDVLLDFSNVGGPVTGPRQDPMFDVGPAQPAPPPAAASGPGDAGGTGASTGGGAATAGPATAAGASGRAPTGATGSGLAADAVPAGWLLGGEPPAPRRPSPATVLFLENGGGKSVLMKLIFSVVLPGRRHVVGTSNGRVLDNFVLPRDCGQVICEWQHAVTGERVVTGKVSEWRGRGPADGGRLADAWYSFRPSGAVELETLPLRRDGRLVTLGGFREAMTRAHAADPALDLTWETHQGAWLEHLDALGLDPELFRYQRAMNAGEGEAAEAFAFTTDEGFVDFLLRAVTPPEDPAGVAEVVDGYAAKLTERAALGAERDFVAGALDRLSVLVDALRDREAAAAGLDVARAEIAWLASAVGGRLRAGEADRAGLEDQLAVAGDTEAAAEAGKAHAGDRVAALRRRLAELRLADAQAARDELVAAARATATVVEGWRASADTLRLAAAGAEAARLTELVTGARDAAAPALAEQDAAARALVNGLLTAAARARAAADEAERRATERDQDAEAAAEAERRALDEAATARAGERAARGRVEAAEAALATAVADGLLPGGTGGGEVWSMGDPPGTTADHTSPLPDGPWSVGVSGDTGIGHASLPEAAAAAAAAARAAAAAVRDALAEVGRLDRERTAAAEASRRAERASDAAQARAASLADQVAAADDAAAAVTADGRIAALLGLAAPAPAAVAPDAAGASAVVATPEDADQLAVTSRTGAAGTTGVTDEAAGLNGLAEQALAALRAAVAAGERRRLELTVESDADRRVLAALGDDDLRPARPEVVAVCAALAGAGISAEPGWAYLARVVPATDREARWRRHPDIVDGVVVTTQDPGGAGATLARAREVLLAARLLPNAAVAVATPAVFASPHDDADPADSAGTAAGAGRAIGAGPAGATARADLADDEPTAGTSVFVVPPNPALYDVDAAATERSVIQRRQDDRARLTAELSTRIEADRALLAAVTGWRRAYPPGRVEALAAELATARRAAAEAEGTLAMTAAATERAMAAADEAIAAVEPLRAAEQRAAAKASELDRLARATGSPAEDLARADELAAAAARLAAAAEAHRADAAAARRAGAEARREADSARRTADAARAEAAEVMGVGAEIDRVDGTGSGPGAGDGDGEDPGTDRAGEAPAPVAVAVLRARYEAATRTYQRVAVGADLTAALELARREEATARAALDALAPEIRRAARELLDGPEGADAASRAAAAATAGRRAEALAAELDEVRERVGGLREEVRATAEEARRRRAGPLTGDQVPIDARHAEELLGQAFAAVRAAEAELGRAKAGRERLGVLAGQHDGTLAAFRAVAETLADALVDAANAPDAAAGAAATATATAAAAAAGGGAAGEPAGAAAFEGGPEEARAAGRAARDSWRADAGRLATAAAAVRAAADAVAAWAGQDRFEDVRAPARRQMVRAGREAVAANAAAWADALAPRLRSLDDDLAHIGRNRAAIVARLEGMVRAALGTLRAAQRLSRLPDQLGDWSGQEFLRISFTDPEAAGLADALGDVIDAAAAAAPRLDGMALLLRAVRAALPRGVRVEVLKPDAVLRTERVRVSELGDVFSGGQQLTAAIILYCTMAALRANDRGQLRAPHAGVLFLDNPIGRASAGYLLDLQLAVADRLGVQLVYTTGLFDTAALAAFPLVIRLRNDADLRAGLKYLRVEEHLRRGLPAATGGGMDAATGVLTATRVYRRPA
ncbi:hypothetical protein [Pseudofrankia sp. EUN1h]|uniref:hypothetical protein n=1 Tax=Pseudofrankia sp. EUN1h TaxID=1834515 RepID=UPI0008DB0B9E|nr:hypothetical protein [Pseudofrankia sp. EUN1h]OHV35943.1 hypothetical protein BCD49_20185 [Pseudofrankia sp. EUN1h]